MKSHDYYLQQSAVTDPKNYENYYEDLPNHVRLLGLMSQNLILHLSDAPLCHYKPPLKKLRDIDARNISAILEKILKEDKSALTKPRPIQKRFVGLCRDYAILLCSILRFKKIPARIRFGFSAYHIKNFYHDFVVLEYWSLSEKRWRIVDCRTNAIVIKYHHMHFSFDIDDVPLNAFIPAGLAWKKCREGKLDPEKLGSLLGKKQTGWWYIRDKLLQDLAALNRQEMLIWDSWGMMLSDFDFPENTSKEELQLLDEIAEMTLHNQSHFSNMREIYDENDAIHVPEKIMSFNPVMGKKEIILS